MIWDGEEGLFLCGVKKGKGRRYEAKDTLHACAYVKCRVKIKGSGCMTMRCFKNELTHCLIWNWMHHFNINIYFIIPFCLCNFHYNLLASIYRFYVSKSLRFISEPVAYRLTVDPWRKHRSRDNYEIVRSQDN